MSTDSRITAYKTARKNAIKAQSEWDKALHIRERAEQKYYEAIQAAIPTSPEEALTARQIALKLTNEEKYISQIARTITSSHQARRNHPYATTFCHETFNGLKFTRKVVYHHWVELDENNNVIGPVHKNICCESRYYIEK